jgi:hypothetical protein
MKLWTPSGSAKLRTTIPLSVLKTTISSRPTSAFGQDAVGSRTVIKVGEKPHEAAISKDGLTAYVSNFGLLEANHKVGTPGTTISVIDVAQKRERTRFKLPPGAGGPHGLKIRPAHLDELFTEHGDLIQSLLHDKNLFVTCCSMHQVAMNQCLSTRYRRREPDAEQQPAPNETTKCQAISTKYRFTTPPSQLGGEAVEASIIQRTFRRAAKGN